MPCSVASLGSLCTGCMLILIMTAQADAQSMKLMELYKHVVFSNKQCTYMYKQGIRLGNLKGASVNGLGV